MDPWHPDEEPAMPARSVIASTLLGVRPPRLPTALLVRSCGLFGISEGTARVAISRMVSAGELEVDDGHHTLIGGLHRRSQRQESSRHGRTRPWQPGDGWLMVVVTGEARPAPERAAFRRSARTLRLAELREGTWMRPDNLTESDIDAEAEASIDARSRRFRAHPEADDATLAASLWDLPGWAHRATRLLDALRSSRPALDAGDRSALRDGFVLSAAVLRHLQADPLLPSALLPEDWPGPALRQGHDDWERSFVGVWRDWYLTAAQATG